LDHKKSLTELEARLRKSTLNPEGVICARTKILVKKKKHSTNKSAPFLQDKMFLDKATSRRLY